MFDHDEGPSDWEIKDEEPPESLRKKWAREEGSASQSLVCPSCQKETPDGNLTCLFCGGMLSHRSASTGGLFSWIQRLFKRG